jgi:hypothetical protein
VPTRSFAPILATCLSEVRWACVWEQIYQWQLHARDRGRDRKCAQHLPEKKKGKQKRSLRSAPYDPLLVLTGRLLVVRAPKHSGCGARQPERTRRTGSHDFPNCVYVARKRRSSLWRIKNRRRRDSMKSLS